ncbi:MAG: hypothetical protein VR72_07930 [Clostridiaceae bacterium BRH_c20a]|nr:MAG: hypothetical protein VR72_07930 [Clostridiaceae bacterium BRH_c20a]
MDAKTKELVEHITTSIMFDKNTLDGEGMSPAIWNKYLCLSNGKKVRKKGDYLLEIGENINGVYFVKKGRIVSNILGKEGIIKTVGIVDESCLFGEQFIFHRQPALFEAFVLEDAEVYFFPKDTILDIMRKDFEINIFIMKSLAIKSRMLCSQIEDVCIRNIAQNICKILYSICCYEEKSGEIIGDILIQLSHQDLANMLGSHRVTVTKNINLLKKQGILDYKYERIIIKDRHKLKKIAFE